MMANAVRWALLCLLLQGPAAMSQDAAAEPTPATTRNVLDDIEWLVNSLLPSVMPALSELVGSPNVSTACTASLFKGFLALKRREPWALRMLLSNGLLPTNILEGSLVSVGSYAQCLKARVVDEQGQVSFKGQYCSLFIKPVRVFLRNLIERFQLAGELTGHNNPIAGKTNEKISNPNIRLGICTPSTCSANDLQFITSQAVKSYGISTDVKGCRTNDPKKMTKLQAGTVAFLCSIVAVVVLATAVEWLRMRRTMPHKKHEPEVPLRLLLTFSAINNMRLLLRTNSEKGDNPLNFLAGFKIFLMLWVVYGHSYIIMQMEFADGIFQLLEIFSKASSQLVANAILSVPTFFFLSGFVLPFMVPKSKGLTGRNGIATIYLVGLIKRYLRMTLPTLAVVMCFYLVPLLVDGPADQDSLAMHLRNCIQRPWVVPAQINNFLPLHLMCLNHLWYVSADMQIFMIIALPTVLMIARYPKTSFVVSSTIGVLCSALTSYQIYKWGLPYSLTVGTPHLNLSLSYLELIYFRPFTHVASYVAGIIAGYLSFHHASVPMSRWMQGAGWLVSLALTSLVMFATVPWNRGRLPGPTVTMLYGGFHRFLWSLGLVWPCYACATGRGGWLNGFMSWKAFRPLSRLTFCIYLTHVPIYYLRSGNIKTNFDLSEFFQLSAALAVFWFSVVFGLVLHLCVEAPVSHLQKFLFEPPPKAASVRADAKPSACENGEQRSRL